MKGKFPEKFNFPPTLLLFLYHKIFNTFCAFFDRVPVFTSTYCETFTNCTTDELYLNPDIHCDTENFRQFLAVNAQQKVTIEPLNTINAEYMCAGYVAGDVQIFAAYGAAVLKAFQKSLKFMLS